MRKPDQGDETHRFVNALSHPIRRQILGFAVRTGEPISPVSTARALKKELSNVTYHFRVLVKAGLLVPEFTRPVRGAIEHFYVTVPASVEHPTVRTILQEGEAFSK